MAEYICRSAAVSALISIENRYNRNRDHENVSAEALYKDLCNAEIEIGKIPAADVAPVVHGRWIPPAVGKYGCICSVCKKQSDNGYDYCPNCGAKMDQE